MTKEYLYESIINWSGRGSTTGCTQVLDEFFDSNVCLPKGLHPHPYADVWHEWAEDTTREIQLYGNDYIWYSPITALNLKARIKPSELIYEWQWMYGGEVSDIKFYTNEEILQHPFQSYSWIKIQETKRVRQ